MDPDIEENIALKAVTMTHVRYARGDHLGHALSWFSLLPVFIGLGGFMTHFFFRREMQAMFFGLGLIVNELVNQVCPLPLFESITVSYSSRKIWTEYRIPEMGVLVAQKNPRHAGDEHSIRLDHALFLGPNFLCCVLG